MKKKIEQNEKQTNEIVMYSHESLQKIEDERTRFWTSYKKHNTIKTVITMICFAAILAAFIVMQNLDASSYITFGIAIALLAVAFGYSTYVKRKFDARMKSYFRLYFNSINEYAFDAKGFMNVELQDGGKITLEEFNECLLYKDVVETGSRGLTNFDYNGVKMSVVDCAGNVKADKRMKPVFVGKMVRGKASYKGEKPIIVYLKGNERSLPPTNIENIKNVLEDQRMVVYSDYRDWKKVLTASVMKALSSIKTDKILVDLALCVYSNKVFVMMGYDDPLMVLPLQNKFDENPSKKYKEDILEVSKLVEAFGK